MIEFAATFPALTPNADLLVPVIRHMIAAAEEWLGPAFDPPLLDAVLVLASSRRSWARYAPDRCRARIGLAGRVRTDPRWLALELAHECIHILAPGPTNRGVTFLEEGLAVEFSMRYSAQRFGIDGWLFANDVIAGTGWEGMGWDYLAAWSAVRKLLRADDHIVQHIRRRQPVLSYIGADLIEEFAPLGLKDAKFLARLFPRPVKNAQ